MNFSKRRYERIIKTLARTIMPRGGKYEKGGDDIQDLLQRFEQYVDGLDRLSQKLLKAGLLHLDYMPTLNFLFLIIILFLTYLILGTAGAPYYIWIVVYIIEIVLLYKAEMFKLLQFGLMPLHSMDEEMCYKYLHFLEKSKILSNRLLAMAMKGLICLNVYGTEDFEKFLGCYEHYMGECKKG